MWAAGLAPRLQHFETASCRHSRRSVGYKPSQSLRHLVVIRQRRCSFPGCRRPAVRSDLYHTTPFDQGGRRLAYCTTGLTWVLAEGTGR
jgi:hypothetical protein